MKLPLTPCGVLPGITTTSVRASQDDDDDDGDGDDEDEEEEEEDDEQDNDNDNDDDTEDYDFVVSLKACKKPQSLYAQLFHGAKGFWYLPDTM